MFEAAVTKFAKAVGDNVLIPVPNLTDSDNYKVLGVVSKERRRWFWQSPKYAATGFMLGDILRGEKKTDDVPITQTQLMPSFTKTNKLSVNGKLGAALKGLLEVEVDGSDSIQIETKFSNIQKRALSPKDALEMVKDMYINTQHQLLVQTQKHPKKVLCIITKSIFIGDPGSIKTNLEIKADEKFDKTVDEEAGVDDTSSKSMALGAGCHLAYSVHEIRIDVRDGSFQIMLDRDERGGFIGEDQVDAPDADDLMSESEQKNYAAIVNLEATERDALRAAIRSVCATDSDVDTMLVMLKQAQSGKEAKDFEIPDMKFKCKAEDWQHVLTYAGFKQMETAWQVPEAKCVELDCARWVFEALVELDEDELEYFVQLEQPLVNPLLHLLKTTVDKIPQMTTDAAISPIFETENPARHLARELGFREEADGSLVAPSDTPSVEGALRATYAIWWQDVDDQKSSCVLL